jgi:hypothetical protein
LLLSTRLLTRCRTSATISDGVVHGRRCDYSDQRSFTRDVVTTDQKSLATTFTRYDEKSAVSRTRYALSSSDTQ